MLSFLYLISFISCITAQTCSYANIGNFMICFYYMDMSYILISYNSGESFTRQSFISDSSCTVPLMSSDGTYIISICDRTNIMISDNSGENFKNTFIANNCDFSSISLTGQYQVLVCDNKAGVYTSSNYGTTWTKTLSSTLCDAAVISDIERYMFIICNTLGFYSSNYGVSWGYTTSGTSSVIMSRDAKYAQVLTTGSGIWYSNNYMVDKSWRNTLPMLLCSPPVSSNIGQYVLTACTNNGIIVSNTYGDTWRTPANPAACANPVISFSGQYMGTVCSNNIYISNDFGVSFNRTINGCNNIVMSKSGQYVSVLCNLNLVYISKDFGNTWVNNLDLSLCNAPTIDPTGEFMTTACNSQGYKYNNPLFSYDYGYTFSPVLCINKLNEGYDIMCNTCENIHYGVNIHTGLCGLCGGRKLSLVTELEYHDCTLYGYGLDDFPILMVLVVLVVLFVAGHILTIYHDNSLDIKMLIGLLIFTGSPAISSFSHLYYMLTQPFYSLGLLYVGLLIYIVPYMAFLYRLYNTIKARTDILIYYDKYDSFEKICYTCSSMLVHYGFMFCILSCGILLYELKLLPMVKIKNWWYYFYTGLWNKQTCVVDLYLLNEIQAVYVIGQSTPWIFILLLNTTLLKNWSSVAYISLVSSIFSLVSSIYRYVYVKFILGKDISTEPINITIAGITLIDIDEGIMMTDMSKPDIENQDEVKTLLKDLHVKIDILLEKQKSNTNITVPPLKNKPKPPPPPPH